MCFMIALDIGIKRGLETVGEVLQIFKLESARILGAEISDRELKQMKAEWNAVKLNSEFHDSSSLKQVKDWLMSSTALKDELGGVHDEGLGWSPNGKFCGECNNITCVGCPSADK